jgi:hypothetical protein
MLKLNPDTLEIICPQGDTGLLLVTLAAGHGGGALPQPLTGVAIFAVAETQTVRGKTTTNTLAGKHVEIVDNTATILLSNDLTRVLSPGAYLWDIRIVTDPGTNEEGDIIADDLTDEVHSLFAARPGGMPKFTVPGVAIHV